MGVYINKLLTKNFSPLCAYLGLDHLTQPFYAGRGQILMFHRVIPADTNTLRIHNHLSLEISPGQLEDVILYYSSHQYDFIHLGEVQEWMAENQNNDRRFVVFTFDDGYKDNLTFAYPVLKRHKVPFTIYIATNLPDKKALFWWYLIEDLVRSQQSVRARLGPYPINLRCGSVKEKEDAFYVIRRKLLTFDDHSLVPAIEKFLQPYSYSIYELNETITLSWNEIAELSKDALVTIGAHTVSHHNLSALPPETAIHEIEESKHKIEHYIQKKVRHFSYPLGQYNNDIRQTVSNLGFETATTTRTSNIFPAHMKRPFEWPRIAINVLATPTVLRLHGNGFFHPILNKFKRIV